jgi:chromosome segregation ATPase
MGKQDKAPKFSVDEYFDLQQELNFLKPRHEEYHKKIDAKVLQKNKLVDELSMLEENIRYSDKVIETLKNKLKELKKITKPTKKSLFGYDSYSAVGELQSDYNGGAD